VIAVPLCPLRDKECVYEKCAWYDHILDVCAIKKIADTVLVEIPRWSQRQ
jgi:hypothetical protein